jgi:hypothetical protein
LTDPDNEQDPEHAAWGITFQQPEALIESKDVDVPNDDRAPAQRLDMPHR